MSTSRRALAPLAVAVALASAPAHAQGGDAFVRMGSVDIVELRDGTLLRGLVVEQVAGDHLTVRLEDGQLRRILWASIQPPSEPPPGSSTSGVSGMVVFAWFGGVAALGGGATIVGSFFEHDTTRTSMQIGGGVALGVGLTIVLAVGAVGLGQAIVAH
jgi:hypothetical protein